MFYGYGILNNHVPTLRATVMKGGSVSPLNTGLYAVYKAENNANDSLGTNNGTSFGGVTYTTGKSGNAFTLNGTNSYVSLPNSSGQFNFTGDFTVSAWINVPGYSKNQFIFCNYAAGSTYGYGWNFYLATNNRFQFELVNGSVIGQYTTTTGVDANTWNHITVVRKVGQTPKIYLNGVLLSGSYTLGNTSILPGYTGSTLCKIGALTSGATTYFSDNKQDETIIWNRELTSTEVTELQAKYYPF
jgi:hypothetical protein